MDPFLSTIHLLSIMKSNILHNFHDSHGDHPLTMISSAEGDPLQTNSLNSIERTCSNHKLLWISNQPNKVITIDFSVKETWCERVLVNSTHTLSPFWDVSLNMCPESGNQREAADVCKDCVFKWSKRMPRSFVSVLQVWLSSKMFRYLIDWLILDIWLINWLYF